MEGVNLTGVDFSNSMLCKIELNNAYITNANFSYAQNTADCSSYLNMNSSFVTNADFSNFSFEGTVFVNEAGFIGTNFTGADVSSFDGDAYFEGATCPDGSTSQTGTMTIAEACSL